MAWWNSTKTTPTGSNLGEIPGNAGTTPVNKTEEVKTGLGTPAVKDAQTSQPLGGGLNLSASKPGDVIAKLALEGGPKVVQQVTQNTAQGGRLVFSPGGTRLNGSAPAHGGEPQALLLEIPPAFRGMKLFSLSLTHSQVLTEKSGKWNGKKASAPGGENDPTPGMSLVDAHVVGKGWVTLSEKKFAEARQEVETLHDLHVSGEIDAIRVKSAAVDPVHVHLVSLNFLPTTKPATFDEGVFTSGIKFGDPWSGYGPSVFRDKSQTPAGNTRYPGAVTLNNHSWAETPASTLEALNKKGWHVDHDSITIPLDGKKLKTVEVAIGDTFPDNKTNNDGSYGKKGWAVLDIEIESKNGKRTPLLRRENVPPQGVLIGSAPPDYVPQPGDVLRVSVGDDTAGIMGVRVGYGA
ncbi:MAG: hypothetical protein U1E65_25110 [Myxococcota bacterium]